MELPYDGAHAKAGTDASVVSAGHCSRCRFCQLFPLAYRYSRDGNFDRHGLHDYDNRENRRVRELIQTAETVKKISPYVTGQLFRAPIAILIDYDNEWDGENDIWHGPLREKSMDGLFCALQKTHIPYDLVNLREDVTPEDLARYQVAFYPHSTIFTKRQKEVLEKAVEMATYPAVWMPQRLQR